MKWPIVKLGKLTKIKTGKLDANAANEDGAYPFFTCAARPSSINTPAFDCKAVLVAGNGDLNVKYYEGKFNAYQRTYVIESLDEGTLLPRYLFLFLEKYVGRLRELAIGGVIKYIKLGNLTDAEIPLPPLSEQKRIAAILDKAEEIRRKREQVIEKLDQLAQSIFLEMFGDFNKSIKFPLIDFGDIITETKLGLVRAATELDETNPLPYLRMNAIGRDGELTLDKLQYANASEEELASYKLITGDFLFNTRNSRELVGKTAVFNMQGLYLFNNNIMRIRFQPSAMPFYVQYVFKTTWFQEQLEKIKSGTTNVFAIYLKELKLLKFPLPKISEQQVFCRRIQKIETLKKIFRIALGSDVALHESLQHQAFTKGFNT